MAGHVAYYRVSTHKQGAHGLGMEAQEDAVRRYLTAQGGALLAAYTEVESGKRNDRPELAKALRHAQMTNSVLLIAKLDRLSRDAHFLLGLQKAGVAFICCDMPQATNLTIGILAMVAQDEVERISRRVKDALAVARRRVALTGQKNHPEIKRLGCPNGASHLRRYGNKAAIKGAVSAADTRAKRLKEVIAQIKSEGVDSNEAVARELASRQFATPRGGEWRGRDVASIMGR